MKRSYKAATGIAAALGLSLAAAAWAAAPMAGGMGPGMMGSMGPGMGGMGPGMMGRMGHGPMAGGPGGPASQLMTDEERAALIEKMRNAKTPGERQKLAEATHEQMQKRAKEKGIVLPEHGPGAGFGPHFTPPSTPSAR